MADATLSRDGTSIDIPLEEESGEILLSASFGKPNLQVRESGGTLNPRINDRWSSLENYQLVGKLFDYQTSHDLADLVKSGSTEPLTLEIPQDVYPDSITVAPSAGSDSALSLSYPSGKRNIVDVELTLTRVGDIRGIGAQPATTPTATGSGPVQIRAAGTTVELPTAGLSVERTVGRPNDAIRRVPSQSDPRYEVKTKVTNDVFTLAFETVTDIPETLNAITDNIFRERLGRQGIALDFNGVLGLGEITAVPTGSSPFRQVHQAGQGWITVPTFEFRRVFDVTQ